MHGQDSRVRELGDVCTTVSATYGTGGGNVPVTIQPIIVYGTQDPCVSDIAFAQGRNNGAENVMVQAMAVRRLTPVECERLQGFPDHYTDIKTKNKPTPDGPRYKSLGNSMAVPVMRWIGERIQKVEALNVP
jgi:site-specific DNA-cytosine methylase